MKTETMTYLIRVDLTPDEMRRLRIAAAKRDLTVREAQSEALRNWADLHEPHSVKA